MATVIRLTRRGKRNQPFYHIVVADQDHPRDGRYTEKIGFYNPRGSKEAFQLNKDRYAHWVKLGAIPSDSIRTLVKSHGAS